MQSVKSNFETELKVWDKIAIIVGEGREAGIYEARVEDIINGGVVITKPEFVSGHTLLRDGVPVAVQITRDDAAYQFYSRVRLKTSGKQKRVMLTPPKRFERVQRRMFARVEMLIRTRYALVEPGIDWSDWEQSLTWHRAHAQNLSGGGILLKVAELMEQDQLVIMEIELFSEANLPSAMVACCRRSFTAEGEKFCGMEFLLNRELSRHFKGSELNSLPSVLKAFDLRTQDRLVTFLFRKQIEFRQKGLI